MSGFIITHLSDLHLTSDDQKKRTEMGRSLTGMNAALKAVLQSPQVQSSDKIIMTGDITDRGDIASWRVLLKLLKKAGVEKRTLIVPGNHDVCGLDIVRFGDFKKADLEKVKRGLNLLDQTTTFPWAHVIDRRAVIFGLDSNNSGNWNIARNAVGRLGNGQLTRLAELLRAYHDTPVKIVALHHSPNIPSEEVAKKRGLPQFGKGSRWMHQIQQDERRMLMGVCVAAKVRLVIHGHLHFAEDRKINSLRIIGGPSTTQPINQRSSSPKYQFWQYTVQGEGGRVAPKLITI